MSKRLKKKTTILVAIVVLGIICMGIVISSMQSSMTLKSYEAEMQEELQQLPSLLQNVEEEASQNIQTYDEIYQSKAQSIAFMANNNAGYKATNAKMDEFKSLLNVDNVLIVSKAGDVIAQAQSSKADFSSDEFANLRAVFSSGKASEAVEIDNAGEDQHMRYYSAQIDENSMVVIEQNPSELEELNADSASTESTLKNISFGQNGYMFAIDAESGKIIYHPDQTLIEGNASDEGFDVTSFEDGAFEWAKLGGKSIYCSVEKIDNTYYVAAVPKSEMSSARNATTAVIAFVFLAVMAMVVIYGVCVLHEEEKRHSKNKDYRDFGSGDLRINKVIARKGAILSFVGLVAILVITFYMQTLFALSSQAVTNNTKVDEVAATIQAAKDEESQLREQYSTRYLNKCKVAAYILDNNSSLKNKKDLQRLADVLQVQYIDIFDAQGNMTISNSSYTNYALSEDKNDSSYEFRKLLQGVDHVVQDARTDEISGELRQYIGVVLHDKNGDADGFVQINIRPSRLQNYIESVQIDNVLDGVKTGSGGFAFAVNKSDNTIAYFPDSDLIGKSATDYGMTEAQLKDGFCDYLTIDGQTYYASSVEQGDYYLYIAGNEGELMTQRIPLTCAAGIIAIVCLLLIFLILILERKSNVVPLQQEGQKENAQKMKPKSSFMRWFFKALKWNGKSPEQKAASILKILVGFSVLIIFIAVVFRNQIFGEDSLFSYIVGASWERSINIFSITACILFICVAMTIATILRKLLNMLAGAVEAKGETICHLLGSCIKYGTIIGMAYYCLVLIGVNTTTLLASAGILSIAISFGAKELVSDILSGLFIIFEGEFHVGDIITVDEWRGVVTEIGVRTTKIMDVAQNTKVIRNSNISNIINMTKCASYIWVDVGVEYSESLEYVEAILAKELPAFREAIPAIISGPFYKGVAALGDSSVDIRIMVQCAEKDRLQVERDLKREIKLLFDRHNIGIPFPQVVINQPLERRVVSDQEREDARRFNIEQHEVGKEIAVEDEEEDEDKDED